MPRHHVALLFVSITALFFSYVPAPADMIVDTAWVRRYDGPGSGQDHALAMVVDDSGNVFVTGWSWGNGTSYDFATVKYRANGDTGWARRYNGDSDREDAAYAIARDALGNIYVAGRTYDTLTYDDCVTIKYAPDGTELWVRAYNGTANGFDRAYAIAIDGSGNVSVTGSSPGTNTGTDYITIKYDPEGTRLWLRRYDGPPSYEDAGGAIAADDSGNVYVTGSSQGDGTSNDYATIKYRSNGDIAWLARYDGPVSGEDLARAIAVDHQGNVYVTGESPGETCQDYATIKYYANGDTAWVRRYNRAGDTSDRPCALVVDDSGNVFVTGESSHGAGYGGYEYATIGYNSSGNLLWTRVYNGLENHYDGASAIAVDKRGNVYVTGRSDDSTAVADYATLKYNQMGVQCWARRYNGTGSGYDWPFAVAIDLSGNVYITGYSYGDGTDHDYATIKYVPSIARGDANTDGTIDLGDIVFTLNYLFKDGPPPNPSAAGDSNCNEMVEVGDAVFLINYLFRSGPPPDC
jgi:hypothetical protein